MTEDPQVLVSTGWLADRAGDPRLRILDATWAMPAAGRDPRAEHGAARIPGARFFDIDAISDTSTSLPHMAPPPAMFADRMRALGISDGDQVVVYDNSDLRSAARAWWTFRLMGWRDVAVLDGGFQKWRAEGRPVETAPPADDAPAPQPVTAMHQPQLVRSAAEVATAARQGDHAIIDARAAERFRGEVAEPRPGLRSGHIPGARNVPFGRLLAADGTFKPPADLRAAFEAAGVDLSRPAITSCGSGITAAVLTLALERIGHRNHALYDGSWTEWGSNADLEIATGDA